MNPKPQQRDILAAFLKEKLTEAGLECDDKTLTLINKALLLGEREPDESQEYRTVKLQEDSTGKITAQSIKLWNITQISLYDILGFLGKETGILLFDDTAKKALYSLIMLLYEFYPKLRIEFNEQDARVLFAIARLKKKEFEQEEIAASYQQAFSEQLSEERLSASLGYLKKVGVLKAKEGKVYIRQEKIKDLKR